MNISKPPYPQIHKCPNGKYRIGNGPCQFKDKASAVRAFEHWIRNKTLEEVKNYISAHGLPKDINNG